MAERGPAAVGSERNDDGPSEQITESVKRAALGDQPSDVDRFGFEPYVDAVSEFLANRDTRPPLTLSVEGEWGSGKSSFMLQLEARLEKKLPKANARFVWFSPWRHDKQESMWAAFALEVMRQLSKKLPIDDRWKAHSRLLITRFDWRAGIWDVLRTVGLLLAWLIGVAIVLVFAYGRVSGLEDSIRSALNILLASVGGLAGISLLVVALRRIARVLGNPFRYTLERHLRSPDYGERVTFLERFNQDFKRIIDAYAPNERAKVFVFVDDLDRCEIPRAADLMQAINLLIGASEKLVFILGMDRSKVAAGLAVKHEPLLPYLSAEKSRDTSAADRNRNGLDFGYAFIEKFVQVAFRLPTPTSPDIERFLETLDTAGASGKSEDASQTEDVQGDVGEGDETKSEYDWRRFTLGHGKDSETVREVTKMVAPALDNNPRRLIQFINTFRLKAYIAHRTGLFNLVPTSNVEPLTFRQLAKFVAIGLKWPTFMLDLDDRRNLLADVEETVLRREPTGDPVVQRWAANQQFADLVKFGIEESADKNPGSYKLSTLNVDGLLAVVPSVQRPEEPEKPPPPESVAKEEKPRVSDEDSEEESAAEGSATTREKGRRTSAEKESTSKRRTPKKKQPKKNKTMPKKNTAKKAAKKPVPKKPRTKRIRK